ncbi:MAG: DUF2946 family protein [Planctomycetota bacterium]
MSEATPRLFRALKLCLPLLFAAALLLAPTVHEAAHDHLHDHHDGPHAAHTACSDHHHTHNTDHPADSPTAPVDEDNIPSSEDCGFTYVLGAPVVPAVPPAVVWAAEPAPITVLTPARRVALGVFSHSFGTRGPPSALDLA